MARMRAAFAVWDTVRKYRRVPAGERARWKRDHPDAAEVLSGVELARRSLLA